MPPADGFCRAGAFANRARGRVRAPGALRRLPRTGRIGAAGEEVAADSSGRPALIPAKAARSWRAVFGCRAALAALAAGIGDRVALVRPGTLNQAKLPAEIRRSRQHTSSFRTTDRVVAIGPIRSADGEIRSQNLLRPRKSKLDGSLPTRRKRQSVSQLKPPRVPETTPQLGAASAEDTLMAKNDAPPIERAKPALQGSESAQPNVNWT